LFIIEDEKFIMQIKKNVINYSNLKDDNNEDDILLFDISADYIKSNLRIL
jgi:hypothetical protein